MPIPKQSAAAKFVVSAAGPAFDALLAAARDYGVPPINFDRDHPGRLGQAYHECLQAVSQEVKAAPEQTQQALRTGLLWHLETGDLAAGLLETAAEEATPWVDPSLFGPGTADSRVYAEHPDLWAALDKDGLLDYTSRRAAQDHLLHGLDAVHYHQFLRRFFTSDMNKPLLQRLLEVGRQPGNAVKIALDHRRLMPAQDIREYVEKDFWHGPQLTPGWLDHPHAVGKTVHACVDGGPGRDYPRFFAYWRMDSEGHKVLQMEELSEHHSAQHGDVRVLRYLHAIRDITAGAFVHCDGAVRAYDASGYEQRITEQLPTGTKTIHYRKLFRVDGTISTEDWVAVVGLWFRHNQLATEYLSTLEMPQDV